MFLTLNVRYFYNIYKYDFALLFRTLLKFSSINYRIILDHRQYWHKIVITRSKDHTPTRSYMILAYDFTNLSTSSLIGTFILSFSPYHTS